MNWLINLLTIWRLFKGHICPTGHQVNRSEVYHLCSLWRRLCTEPMCIINQSEGQWHRTTISRSQLEDSFCSRVVDNNEETTLSEDDGNYSQEWDRKHSCFTAGVFIFLPFHGSDEPWGPTGPTALIKHPAFKIKASICGWKQTPLTLNMEISLLHYSWKV